MHYSSLPVEDAAKFAHLTEKLHHAKAARRERAERERLEWNAFADELAAIVINPSPSRADAVVAALDELLIEPSKPRSRVGKIGNSRPRKSHARDAREAWKLRALRKFERAPLSGPAVAAPLPASNTFNTPYTTAFITPYTPQRLTKRQKANAKDKRGLAAWKHAGETIKLDMAFDALTLEGQATAFTLNLGINVENRLWANPSGALSLVQKRIRVELRAAFGRDVDFAFVLALDRKSEKLHVHGAIDITGSDWFRLRKALARAGGNWLTNIGGSYQVDLKDLYNAPGWASYCHQDAAHTRAELGISKLLSMTDSLTRRAKERHEHFRRLERLALAPTSGTRH